MTEKRPQDPYLVPFVELEDDKYTFDRAAFDHTFTLVAIPIKNENLSNLMKEAKKTKFALDLPKTPSVLFVNGTKMLVLNQKYTCLNDVPTDLQERLRALSVGDFVEHKMTVGYKLLTAECVLAHLLPEGLTVQTAFETVGHIAHVNLKKECLPYQKLIGEILLEKNPNIETVLNKMSEISNEFRVFPMEVIAGKTDLNVELNEANIRFQFNYGEVYWNSRLQMEHSRIVKAHTKKDVACDMMCGIGPFALPIARRKIKVYANDLNPSSYKYLCHNVKLNKIKNILTSNVCGRQFVRDLCSSEDPLVSCTLPFTTVIMNLPASAPEFLDVFREIPALQHEAPEGKVHPRVYCYCFAKGDTEEDRLKEVKERCEGVLGVSVADMTVRTVRRVAPFKVMMCVMFTFPKLPAPGKRSHDAIDK